MNERLATIQEDHEKQYIVFGDSAYMLQSHIRSYYDNEANNIISRRMNYAMKSVRIAVEWNYGYTANIFKYLGLHWKLELLKSDTVSKIYTVATILRNCKAILRGTQCSNYFNVRLPDYVFEKYINQEDFNN